MALLTTTKTVAAQPLPTEWRPRNLLRHNATRPPENLEGRGGSRETPESPILFFRGAAKSALTCGYAVANRVELQHVSGGASTRNALSRKGFRPHV